MNDQEAIKIVTASDNNFIVLLTSLIKSIERNNKEEKLITFYIIDDKIKNVNKKKLEKSIQNDLIQIEWKPLNKALLKNFRFPIDYSTYSPIIYSRLLLEEVVPSTTEKVIYLDSDMLFNKSIDGLWNLDIEDNIIGAVQEPNVKIVDCKWSGIKNYNEFSIPATAKYFNAGLLLVDLIKWKKERVAEKVIDCINRNKKYAGHQPDQYGLNVVLWNKWKNLDPKWNHYSDMACEESPFNIHFVIKKPIFTNYNGLESYKQLFYQQLTNTPWQNFTPMGEFKRKFIKANNIIKKILAVRYR